MRSCPSTEGFGLTPLEALAAGVPPVVLETPVAREVLRDAAVYVAQPDAELVADALDHAIAGETRSRVLVAAEDVLVRYDWRTAAAATLAALEDAAHTMTRLAIVVVSFNARDELAQALESLTAAPPLTSHVIVVVDNASSDGAPAMVRERFPGIRVIDAGGNAGFARANNIGIAATTQRAGAAAEP